MPQSIIANEQKSPDGLGDASESIPATSSKPAFITLVFLPSNNEDREVKQENQYALVRFRESYQDALRLAVTALGRYMSSLKAENIDFLLPIRDKDDKWIWAEINPTDWHLALQMVSPSISTGNQPMYRGEIGVRNGPSSKSALDTQVTEWTFTTGLVVFTYGYRENGASKWTNVQIPGKASGQSRAYPTIDRPKSYAEAIEFIKSAIGNNASPLHDAPGIHQSAIRRANRDIHRCRFKFYSFSSLRNDIPTTDFWEEIPEKAENNDSLWREFVPEPFRILGFTLHE